MRSATLSHDTPKNSVQPTANSASSTSVAPLKPIARPRPRPTRSPIAPPGASGRLDRQPIDPDRFERRAGEQHQREPEHGECRTGGRSRARGRARGGSPATTSTTPATTHHHAEQPEEVEQQVGHPGADDAALVAQRHAGARERPAGIGLGVAREDQREPQERGDDQQPPRFADQAREAGDSDVGALAAVTARRREGDSLRLKNMKLPH